MTGSMLAQMLPPGGYDEQRAVFRWPLAVRIFDVVMPALALWIQSVAARLPKFDAEICAAHSYPREIAFLVALPMAVTGKIMRPELQKLAEADA